MPVRRLPVRPDLEQLHRQAKELLRAIHAGDADAIAELREHHPESIDPSAAKLADAQLVLARSYSASSWTRLVHAVRLADAIWRDDLDAVRALITRNPALIHEDVLIRTDSNWGPPMTYAANLGRDRIIRLLHSHGASDLESAAGRAALQGKADTVRMIYDLAGRPSLDEVDARRSRVHAERRRHRRPASRSAPASSGPRVWTATPWSTSSGPTAGTRPPSTASWRCTSSTASSLPTRR